MSAAGVTSPTDAGPQVRPGRQGRPGRRGLRRVLIIAVVLVVAVLLVVVAVGLDDGRPMGPDDPAPGGHGALGALLRDEDITVTEQTRSSAVARDAGPQATVVVDDLDEALTPDAWERVLAASPGRIVLLAPGRATLRRTGLPVQVRDTASRVVEPRCDDAAAGRAGPISLPRYSALSYVVDGAGSGGCYPTDNGVAMAVLRQAGVEIVIMPLIGSNETLLAEGNASLALQLLGAHPRLVWWQPEYERPAGTDSGSDTDLDELFGPSLLPETWIHAALAAVVAVVVVALWRGRRLGPIIVEPLPVIVPASETVEGHGRLYARVGARDHAAATLREATRRRLAHRLGRADDAEALAHTLAARTGRPYPELRRLLDGPAPEDDTALVRLKRDLDRIEQEARRP